MYGGRGSSLLFFSSLRRRGERLEGAGERVERLALLREVDARLLDDLGLGLVGVAGRVEARLELVGGVSF